MGDLISRQVAINKCKERLYESALNNVGYVCLADEVFVNIADDRIKSWLEEVPSIQSEPNDEQVKEYCKKRCLCLVTYEFIERMKIQYDIPSIECHHCKNWDESWTPSYSDGTSHYCPMIDLVTDEHFYCKYGEFKDGIIH